MSVLRAGDFRRLWLGSTVSLTGDGMTFVALSWLVLAQTDGVSRLGLLGVCYTAPVVLGGLIVGPLLDRFDKRAVLIADSVFRAGAVAATYGLLKMVPLAGFPSAIPALVREPDLNAPNALESLSFSLPAGTRRNRDDSDGRSTGPRVARRQGQQQNIRSADLTGRYGSQ